MTFMDITSLNPNTQHILGTQDLLNGQETAVQIR